MNVLLRVLWSWTLSTWIASAIKALQYSYGFILLTWKKRRTATSAPAMNSSVAHLSSKYLVASEYGQNLGTCIAVSLALATQAIFFVPSYCLKRSLSENSTRFATKTRYRPHGITFIYAVGAACNQKVVRKSMKYIVSAGLKLCVFISKLIFVAVIELNATLSRNDEPTCRKVVKSRS